MLEKYNAIGPQNGYAKGTFDPEKYEVSELGQSSKEMRTIYNQYRGEPLNPKVLEYWRTLGVKKELFDRDKEAKQKMFSVLTPTKMRKEHKYPLIYCLHGGGEDAFSAEFYGYGLLTGSDSCISVYPTASLHGNVMVESEFVRILDFLKEKKYPIDFTRVYVVGFSGGEGAVQRLAMLHADEIAGIGPTPGPNSFRGVSLPILQANYNNKFGIEMPMICLGGSEDGGDMWPLDTEDCVQAFNFFMVNVAKASNHKQLTVKKCKEIAKSSENTVNRLFGLEFDNTWISKVYDTYAYFGEFNGKNGYAIVRIGSFQGMPHTQCPMQAMLIWSFLRQFSRDLKTRKITFNKATVGGANK